MVKFKKLLAFATALSLSVSAFAGLSVTASAAAGSVSYADGKITVTYDANTTASLIVAKYAGGVLTGASSEEVTTDGDGKAEVTKALSEGDKVLLWDSLKGMKPLADVYTVTGNTPAETQAPTETQTPSETTAPVETETPAEPIPTPEPTPTPKPAKTPRPEIDPALVIYKMDHENVSAASDLWTAQDTSALKLVENDSVYGKYMSYDFTGNGANSRGLDSKEISADTTGKDKYVVEFDASLSAGNNQTTNLAIKTSDFGYYSNNVNYGAEKGYLLKLAATAGSTTWTINDTARETVTIAAGKWHHYKLIVDKTAGLVSLTIDNDTDTVLDREILSINGTAADVKGVYVLAGRYYSVTNFDNLIVRDLADYDDFGELTEEVLSSVEFVSQINQKITQPAENEPVHIPVEIKATGNYGNDLTDKVEVKWTTAGLEGDDGYVSLTKEAGTELGTMGENPDGSAIAYFNVRNGVGNWYGNVTANVTYGEDTISISTPFAVIGASGGGANLAPEAGYPENMSDYDDSLVGYTATSQDINSKDLVLNNWSIYGSNGARTLDLKADEDGTKYLQFNSNGGGGSTVGVYQLADQSTQYIVDMKVRFTGGAGTFGHFFNTPNNANGNANWSASFGSGALSAGTQSISGLDSTKWYRIVVSADESAGTFWAKVFDEDGALVGETTDEPLASTASEVQKYFCFQGTYPIDLASFRIYYPTAASLTINPETETVQVPEGTTPVTNTLSAVLKDTDGFNMSGKVTWALDDDYTGVTIDENGVITVTNEAGAGTVTAVATFGTARAEQEIALSTTGNAMAFTKSNSSITIPFAGEDAVSAEYEAEARNKDGQKLDAAVTYAIVDASGQAVTDARGISFDASTGKLTVSAGAASKVVFIRATATVDGETLTSRVKVNIHGLSFAFGTDEPSDDGYTQVTSADAYTDKLGYGFADASTVTDEAKDVKGSAAYTFKAKVPNGNYVVNVSTSSDSITSEVVESVPAATGISKSGTSFKVAVCDGVLDLTFASGSTLSTLTITQDTAKTANSKPAVFAIGDSTTNNTGNGARSWGNCVGGGVVLPDTFSSFSNNGMAGRDSVNFYNQGRVETVLLAVCPGDYVTVNMGINSRETGEGASYETLMSEYYIDAISQRGAIPVIVTATPDGPVAGNASNNWNGDYDTATGKFTNNRGTGARNGVLRKLAQEKDLNIIELGYHFEDVFNALTDADAAAAGKSSVIELVQSWYVDHNHYYEPLGNQIGTYILDCLAKIAGGDTSFNQANDPHINEQ